MPNMDASPVKRDAQVLYLRKNDFCFNLMSRAVNMKPRDSILFVN